MSYRCVITDASGKKLTSNVATLYINTLKIINQPNSVTANLGENVSFTLKATGTGLTYQWEYLSPGSTVWKPSPAAGNTVTGISRARASLSSIAKDIFSSPIAPATAPGAFRPLPLFSIIA